MALTESTMVKLGSSAHDFSLPDTNGNDMNLSDFKSNSLVIIFTCNHCPYAKAVEDRLIDLGNEYHGKTDFVLISSNDVENYPDDAPEKMADFKDNVENLNVRQIVMSSVMTAFGLVVALVWKDTIVATVDYLLPNTDDGTLQGMYISAIAVTILVILLAKFAINLNQRAEKEIERVQSYFFNADYDEEDKKES